LFNEASTLRAKELVKDKKSFHTLIGRAFSAQFAAATLREAMDAKTRFILATVMSSMMVFMVTLIVTYLNLGLRPDFLLQWVKADFIAWPIAATTGFLVMPMARRATDGIVRMIGG
jgi:Protein of unknown function (DUF2798)